MLCTVRLMRFLPLLLLLGLLRVAVAQSQSIPQAEPSLYASLVPDVSVSVKKHPLGPDLVEITMKAAGYPPKLLAAQIQALGGYLKSEPRTVQVWDYVLEEGNPSMHFTKATFAVDGVINRQLGSVRLNPFAKAFAAGTKPWIVNSLDFHFEGEVPTDKMIKLWRSKSAVVEGRYANTKDPRLAGVEFRVKLLTQDPSKMDIPEPGDAPIQPEKKPSQSSGTDWTAITVFLVAAAAVGALVYSLLLRGRPKARF